MEKSNILIIDDDKNIRDLCADILERNGFHAEQVAGGKEGLEMLSSRKFDLVLLDLHMDGMNGYDAIKEIRERDKDIPVVVITAFGTVENAVNSIKEGASDFLVKPFGLNAFIDAVQNNIKIGELSREISRLKMVENILELKQVIISLSSPDILMERVVKILFEVFNPLRSAIYVLDEKNNTFKLSRQITQNGLEKESAESYPVAELSEAFAAGNPVVKKGKVSEIFFPLLSKGNVIKGFVVIECSKDNLVCDEVLKFLETFAMQVSIGMENAYLFEMVQKSHLNTIRSFINTLEARDPCTSGHSEQVAYYAGLLGEKLALNIHQLAVLRNASFLHDLGKVGIKDSILLKTGRLDEAEMELIKEHPKITAKILEPLGMTEGEVEACFHHHEKLNGGGYPIGLQGEQIPFLARILSVADSYSAMICERPYRNQMSRSDAIKELQRCAGTQFDADIVRAFVEVLKDLPSEDNS